MKSLKEIVPESERQAYWENLANYKRIILRKIIHSLVGYGVVYRVCRYGHAGHTTGV
jgi:hypothetical protein